jgi:hypothetical protein
MYKQAEQRLASDGNLRMMLTERQRGGGGGGGTSVGQAGTHGGGSSGTRELTVQVGAFRDRATADREAKSLAQRGVTARVVPLQRDGQQLWAVRVGKFTNRTAAESIRSSVGGKAVITVASGE